MRISIDRLRAAGVSDKQILDAIAEGEADQREKARIRQRNHRARNAVTRDVRDTTYTNTSSSEESFLSRLEIEALATAPAPKKFQYPLPFEVWWGKYPLKVGKDAAFKVWQRVIKAGKATNPELIAGAERYAADPNRDPAYTKHGATWLGAGGWGDQPLPMRGTRIKDGSRLADYLA